MTTPATPYTDADVRTATDALVRCWDYRDAHAGSDARAVLTALAAAGRIADDLHQPLLNLTADEIEAIRRALMQRPINAPNVSSALDKLAEAQP